MIKDPGFDFSFSGLKTAVLYTLTDRNPDYGTPRSSDLPDLCASFQQAVIDILITKTLRAARHAGRRTIALSGGVSLNQSLRDAFAAACEKEDFTLLTADSGLCTDNAAMIAFAALLHHFDGHQSPLDADIDPNLALAL